MNLKDLKSKSPPELLSFAEELGVENASMLRKQDMMFAILKHLADDDQAIFGDGVLEVLQDGFGFLRSPEANYLPGPDDIYVSPSQKAAPEARFWIRKFPSKQDLQKTEMFQN